MPRHRDGISETSEDDDLLDGPGADIAGGDADDDLIDLLYLEKLRGTRTFTQPSQATSHTFKDEVGPMVRKRRKLSDPDDPARDTIAMSSSPSLEDLHATNISDEEDFGVDLGRGDELQANVAGKGNTEEQSSSSPLVPLQTVMSSKFKMTTTTELPTPTPSTRPAFKFPHSRPGPGSSGPGRQSLPDAFSPSRRRGKKDYVPGGAADTVRNWILGLAAEEPKASQAYTQKIRVSEVRHDNGEGRFLLVKGEDHDRWVLLNDNGGNSATQTTNDMRNVRPGSLIGIKGSNTRLDLKIDHHEHTEMDTDNPQSAVAGDWTVGILWDALD